MFGATCNAAPVTRSVDVGTDVGTAGTSGNADVVVVALALAMTSPGAYLPIDPSLHEPLDQAMVVCKGGSTGGRPNEARAFVDYVGSEPGRAIMRKHGFLLPGEAVPPAP